MFGTCSDTGAGLVLWLVVMLVLRLVSLAVLWLVVTPVVLRLVMVVLMLEAFHHAIDLAERTVDWIIRSGQE